MAEFLFDESLARRIRKVVAGENVRCAVAFWGNHDLGVELEEMVDWEIICDLSMGGTCPKALETMKAPNNRKLKHCPGLHAKVYISNLGVVVGSANASARALGFDGQPAALSEAGVFHDANTSVWKSVSRWFDDLYDNAAQVDADALKEAARRYRPPVFGFERNLNEMTILAQIAAEPGYYEKIDVGFVIIERGTTPEQRQKAIVDARDLFQESNISAHDQQNWHHGDVFIGWENLNNLRGRIAEFFIGPNDGVTVYNREIVVQDRHNGNFFTKKLRPRIRTINNRAFPERLVAEDRSILMRIHDTNDREGELYTASQFSEAIRAAFAARVYGN